MPKGIRNSDGLPTALGYHHTEGTKQRISNSLNKLYEDPAERAKHISWLGRKHTLEELAKMGLYGKDNPMWKDTIKGIDKQHVIAEYLSGKSCNDLAQEIGCAYQTVAYHLRSIGILRSRAVAIILGGRQHKFAHYGDNNHFWKGGIWPSPYPDDFNEELKERIRNRDNRKCQRCSVPEYECCRALDVHHIDGNKFNNFDDNLISLCPSCHTITELELGKYICRNEATGRWQGVKGGDLQR